MNWTLFLSSQSKKRFEREWREAERAAQNAEKTDLDINATKADVEKVSRVENDISCNKFSPWFGDRSVSVLLVWFSLWFQAKQQAHFKAQTAEESKNDYAAQLQRYNKEQSQFYFTDMPHVFNVRPVVFQQLLLLLCLACFCRMVVLTVQNLIVFTGKKKVKSITCVA